MRHYLRRLVLVFVALLLFALAGCRERAGDVDLLPVSTVQPPPTAYAPIELPRDDAPHNVLTEWWYYTGHLQADDGRRYGFEYVIFQTVRGDFPVVYLGQLAITDQARGRFTHTSRVGQGSQLGKPSGFDLSIGDWRMGGALGADTLRASMDEYAIDLTTRSLKPAALHDEDGLVSFGVAGDSYYYSYTRLAVEGTLLDGGRPVAVRGQAWFDHQWGNFLVLGGGWDWFSIQLDDGSDLMLNYLRDDANGVVGVWGSYVDPSGDVRPLGPDDFAIEPTGSWSSPRSGGVYPMGWRLTHRDPSYELALKPVLEDQELWGQGNAPTYWEGSIEVKGTRAGQTVSGLGYVELTGYAKR